MTKLRLSIALAVVLTTVTLAAPAAQADTITGQGTTQSNRYRGGDPSRGGVYIASSVQVNRNSAGKVTKVRGAGRITKISGARSVQVDRVALGTSTAALTSNNTPANAGTGASVLSATSWVAVTPGKCVNYRVRTTYSVRWTDNGVSRFSVLSPLTRVCGPTPPPPPPSVPSNPGNSKNCPDFATWAQANAWFRRYYPYYGDVAQLDADNDMIPCESLPGAP